MRAAEKKTLGIIGGMGPGATAELFRKIVRLTKASCDRDHIHVLIDNNTRISDRTTAIKRGNQEPVSEICESGKKLIKMGAQLLVMPCNTSHYFFQQIQEQLSVPMIHMVYETARFCSRQGFQKVGVLGTDGTVAGNLYQKELQKFGIETVYPGKEGQIAVMSVIYDYVKAGRTPDASMLQPYLEFMKGQGCQRFILGCTELPLVFRKEPAMYIDSLEILAKTAILEAGYEVKED